jgi:GDPmannose 4,6-dehydratase
MKNIRIKNKSKIKCALIVGISGQDGAYLSKLLLKNNYRVVGTSRDAQVNDFKGLNNLGILRRVETLSMSSIDFRSVIDTIKKISPDEIYNLSGQSSVGLSFEQPVETFDSISVSTLNILEAIRFIDPQIKFYNASSGEMFGETRLKPADENTPFKPKSPYAVAKTAAHLQVSVYRESYGLFACSGILFNHESSLRASRFVTMKIIQAACNIGSGNIDKLKLGNINISRDWGYAPEYVEAMWKMMLQPKPRDYVIATGQTHSLKEFISLAFSYFNLDWEQYVTHDQSLFRPSEIIVGSANPSQANQLLGWQAKSKMPDVIEKMIINYLNRI